MKKVLLSLATLALMSFGAVAQTTYDWDDIKDLYSVHVDKDIKVATGITDLLNDKVKDQWASDSKYYDFLIKDGEISINFEKIDDEQNWTVITFTWGRWSNGSKPKLSSDPNVERDTLIGYVLDISELADDEAFLTGNYKLTDLENNEGGKIQLRVDLQDCNSHISNNGSPTGDLNETSEWEELGVDLSQDLVDGYTGNWWELNTGRDNNTQILLGTDSVKLSGVNIPVDKSKLIQLQLTLDQDKLAAVDEKYTLTIKDLAIGGGSAVKTAMEVLDIQTAIADAPKTEIVCAGGVVKAEGEITVLSPLGVVVASGIDEVDISSLPTAAYIVQAGNASITVVK